MRLNRGALTDFLEPQQLALSEAGGFKLVHRVRPILEKNREFVCGKIDIRNAHNEISRASVLEALECEPTLRHLAWHVGTCLASHHGLESHGQVWGQAQEGLSQGDPEASPGVLCRLALGCP